MKLLGRDTFVYNQSALDVYYNANAEGMMLEPGTKYYFQFYAIIDGEKVEGKRRSITTKEAEVVEQHIHKWASSTKHAHPHSSIRTCNGCGVSEIVKQSNYMASCTECNPVTEKHFHDWKTKNENAHPHKSVRSCSCGAFEVVKNSNYVSSCTTCNPPKVETVKKVTFKNGTYEISNNASGKFLNAYNSESGWKVVTTNPDGSLEQKFVLNGSNGNYTIKTQGYNGRNLYLNDAMLLTGQTGQFCFVDRGNGAYSISPVNDTSKALTQTNVAIYNYTFVGELFEKFKNHKSDVETFSQIYYVGEKTVSIEYSGKSKSEVITGEIDTCPVVKDGYTYIPARSLVEMIGYEVGWDGITKHISITKIN